jgi:hypothetical protein
MEFESRDSCCKLLGQNAVVGRTKVEKLLQKLKILMFRNIGKPESENSIFERRNEIANSKYA